MKMLRTGMVLLVVVAMMVSAAWAQQRAASEIVSSVKVGDMAPDFTLNDHNNKPVKLSDFRGQKSVVLAFYVLAFTGGWTREMQAYQADIAHFDGTGTQILGISVDSSPSNKKFAEELKLTFPLLSDFKRIVTKQYGILDEERNTAVRTTYVIDKQGIVRQIQQGSESIDPSGAKQMCSIIYSGAK